MRAIAIFFLFLFVSVIAQAKPLDFAANNHYSSDTVEATSEFETAYDAVFKKMGYSKFESEGENSVESPLAWVNRIYSRNGKTRVFAKGGLYVSGAVVFGKLYAGGSLGHFIGHVRSAEHGEHAFFFEGMSEEAAQLMLDKLNGSPSSVAMSKRGPRRSLFAAAFMPFAAAQEAAPTSGAASIVDLPVRNSFCPEGTPRKPDANAQTLLDNVGTRCLLGLAKGVWEATGGLVVSVASGVVGAADFISSPSQWGEKVSKAASAVGDLWTNFDTYLKKAMGNAWDLPMKYKAEVLCELASTVGTGVVVSAFTSGGAAPLVAIKAAQIVERMASLGKLKGLKVAEKTRDFTDKRAAAAKAWQSANGPRVAALKEAEAAYGKASVEFTAAEAKSRKAMLASMLYERGNQTQKLSVLSGRLGSATKAMDSNETVIQAARAVKSVRTGLVLDSVVTPLVVKMEKDLASLAKAAQSAKKPNEIAKVTVERQRLQKELATLTEQFETTGKVAAAPRAGWPEFDATKAKELKSAAIEARAESAKAQKAFDEAAKSFREQGKRSPAEMKEFMKSAAVAGGAAGVAACNAANTINTPEVVPPSAPAAPATSGPTQQ